MGILGALSTAVSGLSAQSYALENISGNIANSQTVGFKRVDTSFVDLIPATGEYTYTFDGELGSLDHIFVSPSLAPDVTGVDVCHYTGGPCAELWSSERRHRSCESCLRPRGALLPCA